MEKTVWQKRVEDNIFTENCKKSGMKKKRSYNSVYSGASPSEVENDLKCFVDFQEDGIDQKEFGANN